MKYKYHPSALKIKEFIGENISEFHFSETTTENIENEIKRINVSKKGTFKVCVHHIFVSLFLSLNMSTFQIKKNDFYFTSKPLFILEKIEI